MSNAVSIPAVFNKYLVLTWQGREQVTVFPFHVKHADVLAYMQRECPEIEAVSAGFYIAEADTVWCNGGSESLTVVNPFEPLLSYTEDRLAVRQDNPKYLNLILAVTFLHQMQRPVLAGLKSVEQLRHEARQVGFEVSGATSRVKTELRGKKENFEGASLNPTHEVEPAPQPDESRVLSDPAPTSRLLAGEHISVLRKTPVNGALVSVSDGGNL